MKVIFILLLCMLASSLWAAMTSLLLRAALAIALTSIILTALMFQMNAPYAAVFELSVCAGLIPVIFISVISLTHRLPLAEYLRRRQSRINRFRYLPLLLIFIVLAFTFIKVPGGFALPWPKCPTDVKEVLWGLRRFDLYGQLLILLAGVFGVLVLFKGRPNDGG